MKDEVEMLRDEVWAVDFFLRNHSWGAVSCFPSAATR